MVNTHWGGVTEDNSFGTHEFLDLCEQLGTEAYICGNVGSGSVEEMADWVEYINFDGISPMADLRRANGREQAWGITYWGVGKRYPARLITWRQAVRLCPPPLATAMVALPRDQRAVVCPAWAAARSTNSGERLWTSTST